MADATDACTMEKDSDCLSAEHGLDELDVRSGGNHQQNQELSQQQEHHYLQQFSPHMEYVVSRHVYQRPKENSDSKRENRVGFLWAWNHMVSRRWKWSNPATGDEQFQNRLLEDFRNFCANCDGRLVQYWRHCKSQHQNIDNSPSK